MSKPLGIKAYGSIGHLPASRLGPGDHKIQPAQARILIEKPRDRHDWICVEEKLDGSCVSVARVEGRAGLLTGLVALGRAGYLAQTSPHEQHQLFAAWVRANVVRFEFLELGERVCGEWLAMAHGTRYDLAGRSPFVAFDLMRGHERAPRAEFRARLLGSLTTAPVLAEGNRAVSVNAALTYLGPRGHYGALDDAEGCVWRVERRGKVDFLGKYVLPDKVDGRYFEGEPVWNWRP